MATKPTLANARFGETAGAVVSGTLVAPLSATRDTGFVASTPAASGQVSALLHEAYLWFKYISDGVFDGDITCTNLHVLGDADIDDDLNVDGDAQIDLTLNVGGNGTFGGYVSSDQNYFTNDQSLLIPAASALNIAADHARSTVGGWWVMTGNPGPLTYPIHLPAGAVITGFTVFCNKSSGASYRAKLLRITSTFTEDDMGLTPGTQTGTGNVTISPAVAPNVTTDGTSSYLLYVYPNSGNFQSGDKIGTVVISWNYPHP